MQYYQNVDFRRVVSEIKIIFSERVDQSMIIQHLYPLISRTVHDANEEISELHAFRYNSNCSSLYLSYIDIFDNARVIDIINRDRLVYVHNKRAIWITAEQVRSYDLTHLVNTFNAELDERNEVIKRKTAAISELTNELANRVHQITTLKKKKEELKKAVAEHEVEMEGLKKSIHELQENVRQNGVSLSTTAVMVVQNDIEVYADASDLNGSTPN
jgi:hypothetical protein